MYSLHLHKKNKEHGYQKGRMLIQDTKKLNCPAVISIKEIFAFTKQEVFTDTKRVNNLKLIVASIVCGIYLRCNNFIHIDMFNYMYR